MTEIRGKMEEYEKHIANNIMRDQRCQICYCNYRYEIEVPQAIVKNGKPDDFTLTSHRWGYQRFQTPYLL